MRKIGRRYNSEYLEKEELNETYEGYEEFDADAESVSEEEAYDVAEEEAPRGKGVWTKVGKFAVVILVLIALFFVSMKVTEIFLDRNQEPEYSSDAPAYSDTDEDIEEEKEEKPVDIDEEDKEDKESEEKTSESKKTTDSKKEETKKSESSDKKEEIKKDSESKKDTDGKKPSEEKPAEKPVEKPAETEKPSAEPTPSAPPKPVIIPGNPAA